MVERLPMGLAPSVGHVIGGPINVFGIDLDTGKLEPSPVGHVGEGGDNHATRTAEVLALQCPWWAARDIGQLFGL